MLRGATARGMRGIAPARPIDRHDPPGPRLVRPMLSVTRADARELLTALSEPWREDRTNAEPVTLRNRLRAEVIPRLLELKPAAPERAASLASQMRSLTSLLEHTAAALHAEAVGPEGGWRRDTLRDAETVVIGELIRAEIARRDPACRLDRVGHRSLRAAARAAKDPSGERRVFEVGDGWVVERTKEALRLVRRPGPGAGLS
jgi:tRNA(Ile)-lysidine synthase